MNKTSFLFFCALSVTGCVLSSAKALSANAQNVVTDVFSDPVSVKTSAHAEITKVPASTLLNHPVLGADPVDGWLQVQTDQGVVLVKPSKVGTSGKVALPKNTNCFLLTPTTKASNNETPGLATGCK